MSARLLCLVIVGVALGSSLFAAEEAPKSGARDLLKARIAEDAKKTEAKKTAPTATAPTAAALSAESNKANTPTKAAPTKAKDAQAPAEPPTVLPKVEVKKGRITELDRKLAKQEQDIEREKKNLKTTEVDAALNDAKIARPLAIFGGESAQFRKRVASERVELMEAEKDLLEAIARARTKEEKADLQKQLDEVRAVRRELDKTLR